MVCQRCRHRVAGWVDTYAEIALCNDCCDRTTPHGQRFVEAINPAWVRRLSEKDTQTWEDTW
jgi:hypothetical protein